MVNKKKPGEKKEKGKGILLNLKPELRTNIYKLAEKEKRSVTSLIEEAISIFINNKLAKLNDDIFGSSKSDGGLFGGSSNKDFDLDKELNIL